MITIKDFHWSEFPLRLPVIRLSFPGSLVAEFVTGKFENNIYFLSMIFCIVGGLSKAQETFRGDPLLVSRVLVIDS